MPTVEKPQMEKILEQIVGRKTRRKMHHEYLVKWKDHPVEDSSWVTEPDILKHGKQYKSSWIGVHEYFGQRSMMQEHRYQIKKSGCGSEVNTSTL
jgi:hypothetical protein